MRGAVVSTCMQADLGSRAAYSARRAHSAAVELPDERGICDVISDHQRPSDIISDHQR